MCTIIAYLLLARLGSGKPDGWLFVLPVLTDLAIIAYLRK